MTIRTMESEFLAALRPGSINLDVAKERLNALRDAGASDAHLAFCEANMLFRVDAGRKDDALRIIVASVINVVRDDVGLIARSLVVATRLADECNDGRTMGRLHVVAQLLFAEHGENIEVYRWRSAIELNIGIYENRVGRHREAITTFEAMLLHMTDDPAYACWRTNAHAQIAIAYARLGDIVLARHHAALADSTGLSIDEAHRRYVWGVIALHDKHYDEARRCFIEAYRKAKDQQNVYIMADTQLELCRVYKALRNVDAFWYAYERAHDLAVNNGTLHIIDALAEVRADMPNM